MAQHGSQERPQEASKNDQKSRTAPRGPQERPKRPPGHKKVSKNGVKMAQNPSSIDSKLLRFSFLEAFPDRRQGVQTARHDIKKAAKMTPKPLQAKTKGDKLRHIHTEDHQTPNTQKTIPFCIRLERAQF